MTTLDMTNFIAPKSDQANADDFLSGPRTFTVGSVRGTGSDDQPIAITLAEFPAGRPFKPSKSMMRVMVEAWGKDAATYVGKRFTLYRDPKVRFGGQDVGGIRISHMSDLPGGKPLKLSLTVTRGKREPYTVKPLDDSTPSSPAVSDATLAKLVETLARKGVPEADWLRGVNHYIGGAATALEVITEDQAQVVLDRLSQRPDADTASAPAGESDEQCPVCGGRGDLHDAKLHEEAGV